VFDVTDIVSLVGCVLAQNCDDCAGDVNNDGGFDVLDVVMVNQIMAIKMVMD
jgi:hypothetical protein